MSVPMKWGDYPSPLVTLFDISEWVRLILIGRIHKKSK